MIVSRETILSLLYRIGTIGLSFASTSFLIKTLGPDRYGAWATLMSALVWIQMSDLGIGYVIKNRVAAKENLNFLCEQIAVAVRLSLMIGLVLVLLYFMAGTALSVVQDFPMESTVLYVSALLSLPSMIGVNILQGLSQSSVAFQASMIQSIAWLGFILILGHSDETSLRSLSIAFALLWLINGTYIFFRGYYALGLGKAGFTSHLFSRRTPGSAIPLLRIGGAFFLLQLSSLVLFNLGTFLAYSYFSARIAAKYDILNKIYQIPLTLFNVIIAVAWPAIATAISQRNAANLRKTHTQLIISSLIGGASLLFLSAVIVPPFVQFYSHNQLTVSNEEVFWFALQIAVQMLAYSGAVFMNAAERLRVQILFAIASTIAFLPLFFLLQSHGIAAISLSTLLVVLPGAVHFNVYVRRHIIAGPHLAEQPR